MTKLTAIESNRQLLDGGAMFGNAPRTVWERWFPPDGIGRISLACRCMLIEIGDIKILCEAGIGAFFGPKLAERFGVQTPTRHRLRENLLARDYPLESIDYVILSHLHFDHAGGLLPTYQEQQSGNNGLVFPNAKFIVGSEAWERALHPHARDRASFIPGLTDKLLKTGRLLRMPQDPLPAEISKHLEFLFTSGHTPGHMHTLFSGDAGGKVFFCGDLIPGRAWVHLPITMGYDRFPEQLIDEKAKTYVRAVSEDWILFYTHDPEYAGSHVKLAESGKYEPQDLQRDFNLFTI